MSKKSDLEHALHNEKVFHHVSINEEFSDWIVTTAFYSALHFVDYKLFPLSLNNGKGITLKLDSLDSYAISIFNEHNNDKHTCRLNLVKKHLKEISSEFGWLSSTSNTARYHNYTFSDPHTVCKIAKEYLEKIKAFCMK